MQPQTTSAASTAPINYSPERSKMAFTHNGVNYRLRFSYSPDDRVVTRATIEYQASKDGKVWEVYHYAQVYLKGGAHGPTLKEQERQRALNKLLYSDLSNIYTREFSKKVWAAYWQRGKATAPAKY